MWNEKLELSGGSYSVSDIHRYIGCIIKKDETLTKFSPFQVNINRISHRLCSKDRYRLQLGTSETMILFGSTKKTNRQNKKWRKCTKS